MERLVSFEADRGYERRLDVLNDSTSSLGRPLERAGAITCRSLLMLILELVDVCREVVAIRVIMLSCLSQPLLYALLMSNHHHLVHDHMKRSLPCLSKSSPCVAYQNNMLASSLCTWLAVQHV
jgi:hypothetical protein